MGEFPSGIKVISHHELTIATGQAVAIFITMSFDGELGFFFNILSDRYLILSGEGDLALLAAIASSVRVDKDF